MPKIRLILQARLNSSRLPGKMLLPVAQTPLILLCAKRATNTGLDLIIATSDRASDDMIASLAEKEGYNCCRGDLNDVLARFVKASKDMEEEDLIVRLTGDNPFVDGAFIDDLIKFHNTHNKNYTRTLSPQDGFPYGLSAEVISVKALRKIDNIVSSQSHREHVTLKPTEEGAYELFNNNDNDLSHLRATIDTFDDYLRVSNVFKMTSGEAEIVSWQDLVKKLSALDSSPKSRVPYKLRGCKAVPTLALGTVQLGLDYGIANTAGKPNAGVARNIMNTAIKYGINSFDTAAAYGSSEQVIGRSLSQDVLSEVKIVTKLSPMSELDCNKLSKSEIAAKVENSVLRSLHNLCLNKLPVLLLHRWSHYKEHNGIIIETLRALQKEGLIGELGASVQNPAEGMDALKQNDVKYLQIPYNILDNRWENSEFIDMANSRDDVHIQARSVLLQGVLTLPAKNWPIKESLAQKAVLNLQELTSKYKRKSIIDLCYAFVRKEKWIDDIVVGVETVDQLMDNIEMFNQPALPSNENIQGAFTFLPETFLNPQTWNK